MSNLKQAIPKRMAGFHGEDYAIWIGQVIAGMCVAGFTECIVPVKRQRKVGTVVIYQRDDTVQGYCACSPLVSRSLPLRKLRDCAKVNQLFPCSLCRPEKRKTELPTATSDGRVSAITLKRLNALPSEQRAEVYRIVYDHVQACLLNNFEPENLDRAFIEAIEVVRIEARTGQRDVTAKALPMEPFRRYGQYAAPKDAWMN